MADFVLSRHPCNRARRASWAEPVGLAPPGGTGGVPTEKKGEEIVLCCLIFS